MYSCDLCMCVYRFSYMYSCDLCVYLGLFVCTVVICIFVNVYSVLSTVVVCVCMFSCIKWLKYKKFSVGTPIRDRLATAIRDVGTLMCQILEVWERCSRLFPLTLNTGCMYICCLYVYINM